MIKINSQNSVPLGTICAYRLSKGGLNAPPANRTIMPPRPFLACTSFAPADFGGLDDEIVNTVQDVVERAGMVEQQPWLGKPQNATCSDGVRHRYCHAMLWFKCQDVIKNRHSHVSRWLLARKRWRKRLLCSMLNKAKGLLICARTPALEVSGAIRQCFGILAQDMLAYGSHSLA